MNIVKRALFGGIYVALIVAALLLWETSKILFLILFSCFVVFGMLEASRLLNHDGKPLPKLLQSIDCAGGVALLLSFFAYYCTGLPHGLCLVPVSLYLLLRLTLQLYLAERNAIADVRQSLASLLYVALPLAMLCSLASKFSPQVVLCLFIFLWLYDTGAFLVGCAIGKHRLFERISPKKAWEGVGGGAAAVIAAAIVIACVDAVGQLLNPQDMSLDSWIAMGLVVVVAGTLGDLFESLLKRTAGVKDSGNLIPGHGGILDRIDSLLFAAPAVLMLLEVIAAIQ